jgi:hypothetical protein
MRRTILAGWVYHIFQHYLINAKILGGKIIHNVKYVLPSTTACLEYFSFAEEINEMLP